MYSSGSPPEGPNSVTLTDSNAKKVPILCGIWVVLIVFGAALLVAGVLFLSFILLVIAAASAFWVIPNGQAFFSWHPAEAVLPANGFALGATQTVTYRRRPRKISDIAETQIELTLECVEIARYRVGTNTRTETETVVQQTFNGIGRGTPNGFEATIPIKIPSNAGGPTLRLSNNRVKWEMKIQPDPTAKLPTQEATFPIVVGPMFTKPDIQDASTSNQTPQDGVR